MLNPLISIIIPTYNRKEDLRRLISSIINLKGDLDEVEVIVVDDGGKTPFEKAGIDPLDRLRLTLIRQKNQGPAAARNYGAKKAKGNFFVFLDDDCTLPVDWYLNVRQNLNHESMLIGHTENMLKEWIFSEASQELTQFLFSYYNSDRFNAQFITSNNMITPRRLFRKLGGFSRDFPKAGAEDRDFCDRWLAAGYNISFVPIIVVEHRHKMHLYQFLCQHFRYGKGAEIYHQSRSMRKSEPIKIEPVKFYYNLLLFPWRKHKPTEAFALSLCLFISQISNAGGFYWTRLSNRLKKIK